MNALFMYTARGSKRVKEQTKRAAHEVRHSPHPAESEEAGKAEAVGASDPQKELQEGDLLSVSPSYRGHVYMWKVTGSHWPCSWGEGHSV